MANKLPLLGDDFEIWGHWWLPNDPGHKIAGKLSSRFGRLELKLIQPLPSINPHDHDLPIPVIHGVGDTKLFTLWDSVQTGFAIEAPGTTQPIIRHMRVLVGGHLGARSETTFSGFSLYGANIGPWSGIKGVGQHITIPDDKPAIIEYRMSEDRSQEVELSQAGLHMTISQSWESKDEEFRSYGFNMFPAIQVKCVGGASFQKIRGLWESLSNFISLVTGREFVTERITLEMNNGKSHDDTFELRVGHPPPEEDRMFKAWEVLAPLGGFGDQVVQIFEQWFSNSSDVRDSIDLLIGNLRRRELPLHVQISTLCQALESFHRTTVSGGYISKKEYKPINSALMTVIPKDIDEDLQKAIGDRLRYAYEYSLRTRLGQLVDQLEEDNLVQLGIEKEAFVSDVCKARNDFTHWDGTGSEDDDSEARLLNLSSKLKLFTQIILLKYFGIDEKLVVCRAMENRHIHFPEWESIPVEE
ncbi:MAG TPA: HEPN domain-containing protein [Anaerolineales bacterium]|nr:HEPN domain-containing protein [Anaerolineales bacterium]